MIYPFFTLLFLLSSLFNPYTAAEELLEPQRNGQELLLCRKCGADVADSSYLFHQTSPGAHKTEQRKLFGQQNVTVLTLVNPFGVINQVITAEKARCQNIGHPQSAESWFPNFKWRVCVCPQCGQHLGWTFESIFSKEHMTEGHIHQFHGLILNNVLGENFTDSLIMMPKTYRM